jgi:hypothetical protein
MEVGLQIEQKMPVVGFAVRLSEPVPVCFHDGADQLVAACA